MSFLNPQAKIEEAADALATAVAPAGYTVSRGEDDETKTASMIHVIAEDLEIEEGMEQTGNWRAMLRVVVKSNATDTTRATHQTNCSTVFQAFMVDDISTQLSAAATDFTVQGVIFKGGGNTIGNAQSWMSELRFELRHVICTDAVGY